MWFSAPYYELASLPIRCYWQPLSLEPRKQTRVPTFELEKSIAEQKNSSCSEF